MADAGRFKEVVRQDLCRIMGWSATSRRNCIRKISRLLCDIDTGVKEATTLLRACDLEGAVERLEPFNKLWVGVFTISEASLLLPEIVAYQTRYHIYDAYISGMLSPEVATVQIWYDP